MSRTRSIGRAASSAAVVFLMLPFAGCLGSGGTVSDVEAPAWSPGYAWSWNTTGSVHEAVHLVSGGRDPVQTDRTRAIDPYVETVEVLNTTARVDSVPVYVTGYRTTLGHGPASAACDPRRPDAPDAYASACVPRSSGVELTGFRQGDLASVPLSYSWRSTCLNGNENCRYVLDGLRVAGSAPEHAYLDFPLDGGKAWGGPLSGSTDGPDGIEWSYEGRVKGRATVDTPLGPLHAVRVDFIKEPMNMAQWKKQVVEEARQGGAQIDAFDYQIHWRRVVHYSEDLATVVRATLQVEERLAASGSEGGHRFQIESLSSREITTVVTGAQLVPKPERGWDYIARMLAGEIPLTDPAGHLPDPRRFVVSIEPENETANAFGDEVAHFSVTVRQEGGGPATDVDVAWRITDYRRRAVAEGNGTRFAHDFDVPGVYQIEVSVKDPSDGRPLASAQQPFEVVYDAGWTHASLVSVQVFLNHPPTPIPVMPGITSLVVEAQPVGPMSAFNGNRLVVRDPTGTDVGGDGRRVVVDDFSPFFVNENPWTVHWMVAGAAVMDDVVISVQQRYGTPPRAPPAQVPGLLPWGIDGVTGSLVERAHGGILAF